MPNLKNINVIFISINNNNILITSKLFAIHLKNIFKNNNNNLNIIIKELIFSSDWIKKNYRKKNYSYLMNFNKDSINFFIDLISNIKKEEKKNFFEFEFDKNENEKEKKIIIKYLINILKSYENKKFK
jgi:hypothetical protein